MSNLNGLAGLRPDSLKDRVFVGTVIANDDSTAEDGQRRQRIKVTVPDALDPRDGYTVDTLPWCLPHHLVEHGPTWGAVDVPSLGSRVYVVFQDGVVEYPFYTGACCDDNPPAELLPNYPQRRGRVLKNGSYFWVDESDNSAKVHLPSGFEVFIDPDGGVKFTIPGNAEWAIDGDLKITVGGKADITATQPITITTPNYIVNG